MEFSFLSILRDLKLLDIINEGTLVPLETIIECDKRIVNIAFDKWYEKGQMVLSWINSTLLKTVIPYTRCQIF